MTKKQQQVEKEPRRGFIVRAVLFCLRVAVVFCLMIVGLAFLYRTVPPPMSALMLWRLPGVSQINYRWQPLSRISNNLAYAVIASEDGRFCRHDGVDWQELESVWEDFRRDPGSRPRGASTIPMQVARNLFLWPSRNYLRKALEVPIAYLINAVWSKRRMIEIYLNIIEWGPGLFGAEAASQHYFNRSAKNLTRTQASLLAAALPLPLARNPARPSRKLNKLAHTVQKRLRSIKGHARCISADYRG